MTIDSPSSNAPSPRRAPGVKREILRIANASAFWGDSPAAAATLLDQAPDIDYLTLDYLAEVTMSILARQKQRDAALGYARDFLDVMQSLIPVWKRGSKVKVITNAGGLNPGDCARSSAGVLEQAGLANLRIACVDGDGVLDVLRNDHGNVDYAHLESKQPLSAVFDRIVTANAYLGAAPLVDALRLGADIVITGRVADPSLAVAPCMKEFNWNPSDHSRLAAATVAGHLIECGTQVTGGISTDWMSIEAPHRIGFPIVEIAEDGTIIVTKPANTSGTVNLRTVKEQLLYELGDPDNYLSPDATVSFLSLHLEQAAADRVRVTGAIGRAATDFYKVTATYRTGFRASGTLTVIGHDAVAKARRAGEMIRDKLKAANCLPEHFRYECLGSGDSMPGVLPRRDDLMETVLRVSVMDERAEPVEKFSRELIPLVTSGPQGTTGYFDGRPAVREVFGYWPCLIRKDKVAARVSLVT